jgi:TetR/AcrR family transcriptional regulator
MQTGFCAEPRSAMAPGWPSHPGFTALWIDNAGTQSYINNPPVINFMPRSTPIDSPAPKAHIRPSRRKEARPGELLAAALDLFVEKGFAATRVEEVAQRAGVSKGTLFLYFASKEELFKAVVRENISGRFTEWNAEFEQFEGSTPDMLRYCLFSWWERIGSTKASGIPKLIMSEAQNFPELASFYQAEVMQPGTSLIARILQRGVARGEFRPMDFTYGVYLVLAPMLFLAMWRHSLGTCCGTQAPLDPQKYLTAQLDMLLYGFSTQQPQPTTFSEHAPT